MGMAHRRHGVLYGSFGLGVVPQLVQNLLAKKLQQRFGWPVSACVPLVERAVVSLFMARLTKQQQSFPSSARMQRHQPCAWWTETLELQAWALHWRLVSITVAAQQNEDCVAIQA